MKNNGGPAFPGPKTVIDKKPWGFVGPSYRQNYQAEIKSLRSQLTAVTAQNEKLREELRKLEWAISNRFAGGLCPQLLRPKAYYRLPR